MSRNANNNTSYRTEQKVFSELIGKRAHIDRLTVSVWGKLKKNIKDVRVRPLAKGQFYSALMVGKTLHGNPFTYKFGRLTGFANVPPGRLDVRSDATPLTLNEVDSLTRRLFQRADRIQLSRVELTFDLAAPFIVLAHHLFSKTRRRRYIDNGSGRTQYLGSPNSPLQVKLYEKSLFITRLEVTLRRSALKKLGLIQPKDIAILKSVDFSRQYSFREVDAANVPAYFNGAAKATILRWPICVPLEVLAHETRTQHGHLSMKDHRLNWTFGSMQRHLVW
jgi:hypothetical protein